MLLDAFAVVEEMRKKHPQHFATLTRVPTTFRRIHSKRLVTDIHRYVAASFKLIQCKQDDCSHTGSTFKYEKENRKRKHIYYLEC